MKLAATMNLKFCLLMREQLNVCIKRGEIENSSAHIKTYTCAWRTGMWL